MVETQHVRSSLDFLSTQLTDLTTGLDSLRYISGAKVGADLTFHVDTTSSGTPVTQTVTKPIKSRDGYQFFVHNPSTVTSLTFDLFTVTSSLAAADRNAYLLSFGTTMAVCTPTSYDVVRYDIARALFGGGDLKIVMRNDVGSTDYIGTATSHFDVTVRLIEFI